MLGFELENRVISGFENHPGPWGSGVVGEGRGTTGRLFGRSGSSDLPGLHPRLACLGRLEVGTRFAIVL